MTDLLAPRPLGWVGIVRLGLVQMSLGAIVVLTTSTMNRVMVVEWALPATLPGLLVGWHYALQVLRPRLGYGSDVGGRRTPWIIGGIAVLALGGILAAAATAWMGTAPMAGTVLAVGAFTLIGLGVGAGGTALLVLLAKSVAPERRAAAATTVWLMMIGGFAVTAAAAGSFLDPFTPLRLVAVTATVAATALAVSTVAVWGVERRSAAWLNAAPLPAEAVAEANPPVPFREALREVWAEPQARRFSIFVFVSMLAYSAQDLILEPFAGTVFGMTPGESTRLTSMQQGGVLVGMLLVGFVGSRFAGTPFGSLKNWTIAGCIASSAALLALAIGGYFSATWPLRETVFALGVANGAFAVAAIGSMMNLVSNGREKREGLRMGLWGAAQAIAFGLGGFAGTLALDMARLVLESPQNAYAIVFGMEAVLFLVSVWLAVRVGQIAAARRQPVEPVPPGEALAGEGAGG